MVIVSEQKENNWVLNSDTPDCLLWANKPELAGQNTYHRPCEKARAGAVQ